MTAAAQAAPKQSIPNNVFVVFITDIFILPGSQHVLIHPGKPQRSPDWKARSRQCRRPTTAEIQFLPPFWVKG